LTLTSKWAITLALKNTETLLGTLCLPLLSVD
jgi:hypothetical protein